MKIVDNRTLSKTSFNNAYANTRYPLIVSCIVLTLLATAAGCSSATIADKSDATTTSDATIGSGNITITPNRKTLVAGPGESDSSTFLIAAAKPTQTLQISKTANSDFTLGTDTCSGTSLDNSTCSILVTFSPATTQPPQSITLQVADATDSAEATITGDVVNSLLEVTGTGTFPTTNIGSSSFQSFSIRNTGQATAGDIVASVVGDNFEILDNGCTDPLAQGDTCIVSVRFSPAQLGTHQGTFAITSQGQTISESLEGTTSATIRLTVQGANHTISSTPPGIFCSSGTADSITCDGVFTTSPITLFANDPSVSWIGSACAVGPPEECKATISSAVTTITAFFSF